MSEMFGIDVAKWNGTIDWKHVAMSKSFAILKVTNKSNHIEELFETNYREASKAGLIVGVYRYVYAKNTTMAKAEADAIVTACKNKKIPFGVWLDMEDSSIKSVPKNQLTEIIKTEANILQKAGLSVGVYCNKDWYDHVLDGKNLVNLYPFWIARYPSTDDGKYVATSQLNPKSFASAWQYSSKGHVDGVKGTVDLDVAFSDLRNIFVAHPTVRKYEVGNQARHLQTNLNRVIEAGLEPDGKFGPKSVAALKKWQSVTGLNADGVYGPLSYQAMRKILA